MPAYLTRLADTGAVIRACLFFAGQYKGYVFRSRYGTWVHLPFAVRYVGCLFRSQDGAMSTPFVHGTVSDFRETWRKMKKTKTCGSNGNQEIQRCNKIMSASIIQETPDAGKRKCL